MSQSPAASDDRAERDQHRPDRPAQAAPADKQPVMTDYRPEHYAFRFPNAFVNHIWRGRLPPLIGRKYEMSTRGRCGGMVFASLDFYHLGVPVPSLSSSDFSSSGVPPDGHPLADYIYARQLHSMLTRVRGIHDGLRYLRWSGQTTITVLAKTTAEEKKVIASLNRGQPVVLGLIKATSMSLKAQGANHQVVCYGYRTAVSGHVKFYIYDPNEPFQASSNHDSAAVLSRVDDFERSEFPFQVIRHRQTDRWRGFFVVRYQPMQPDAAVIHGQGSTNR